MNDDEESAQELLARYEGALVDLIDCLGKAGDFTGRAAGIVQASQGVCRNEYVTLNGIRGEVLDLITE